MKDKTKKNLFRTAAVLAIIGGAAHVSAGFLNYDLLAIIPQATSWSLRLIVQGLAGVATIYAIFKSWK